MANDFEKGMLLKEVRLDLNEFTAYFTLVINTHFYGFSSIDSFN